jgi:hypothetical protein
MSFIKYIYIYIYIHIIKGICTLGPRDVVDVMTNVNTFLDENPSEVIIFIYQVNNDVDQQVDLNAFYDKLTQVDGIVDKLYVHDDLDSPWPTLRDLTNPDINKVNKIKINHILIVFISFAVLMYTHILTILFVCLSVCHFKANHNVSLQRSGLQYRSISMS